MLVGDEHTLEAVKAVLFEQRSQKFTAEIHIRRDHKARSLFAEQLPDALHIRVRKAQRQLRGKLLFLSRGERRARVLLHISVNIVERDLIGAVLRKALIARLTLAYAAKLGKIQQPRLRSRYIEKVGGTRERTVYQRVKYIERYRVKGAKPRRKLLGGLPSAQPALRALTVRLCRLIETRERAVIQHIKAEIETKKVRKTRRH